MAPRSRYRPRTPRTLSYPAITEERQERAWRAIQEFNKLAPTFTSFARAMTGDSAIYVKAHPSQSSTDGRVIHIAPPIALGDRMQHERNLCETRDPVSKMKRCKACATRELLMRRTYHEISHIIFKSLERPQKYLRNKIIQMINEWHPTEVCDHQMRLLPMARAASNYMELVNAFSPYLLAILRSYEDARVDSKMYRVRPGLKAPTEASLTHVFTQGIQGPDDTIFWRDALLEGQITIGLLLLGLGIEPKEGWLSDEARGLLDDQQLREISEQILFANNPANAVEVTIRAFEYLQTKGLLVVPKCTPVPPLPQEEENDNDTDSEDSGSGSGSEEGTESSDEADSGDSGDPSAGESGADGSGEADSSSEETESEPGASDPEGDDSFENEDSTDSGEDPEDGDSTDQSNEADESTGDKDEESTSRGQDADGLGDDPNTEDSAEESAGKSGSEESPEDSGDDDEESSNGGAPQGSGDSDSSDSESESDHDKPESGATAQGLDPSSEHGTAPVDRGDPEKPETGVEDEPVGDGTDSADEDKGADGPGKEGTAPPSPELKGAEVWDEDNPETEVITGKLLELLDNFLGHGEEEKVDADLLGEEIPSPWEKEADSEAISMAVTQAPIFDSFSGTVNGLEVIKYPDEPMVWGAVDPASARGWLYEPEDFMVPEQIIGKTLLDARAVFTENKRAKHLRGRRSGKVNAGVLGRRAPVGDDRLFEKKIKPGKRDYEVLIGVDVSGSTRTNDRLTRIKRAVFAQAELLNRLGVNFSIYAHTGGWDRNNPWNLAYGRNNSYKVWLLEIKAINEQWGLQTRRRLAHLNPLIENLDGHTIEFYRKQLEKSRATDKILLYYTDGAMPAANHDEELIILQRELMELDRRKIIKLAVGVNTDSPSRYGFDTVQVDRDEDLEKVIAQLRRHLI